MLRQKRIQSNSNCEPKSQLNPFENPKWPPSTSNFYKPTLQRSLADLTNVKHLFLFYLQKNDQNHGLTPLQKSNMATPHHRTLKNALFGLFCSLKASSNNFCFSFQSKKQSKINFQVLAKQTQNFLQPASQTTN